MKLQRLADLLRFEINRASLYYPLSIDTPSNIAYIFTLETPPLRSYICQSSMSVFSLWSSSLLVRLRACQAFSRACQHESKPSSEPRKGLV